MKVNPLGIDAYRQTMDRSSVNNKPTADRKANVERPDKVEVPLKSQKASSKLAVKLNSGTYADNLSAEEKQALEMVFDRFRQMAGKYNAGSEQALVGNFVDVKL